MRLLYADSLVILRVDPSHRAIWLERTSSPLVAGDAAKETLRRMGEAVAGFDVGTMGFVVDLRAVRGRNDDAFEGSIFPPFVAFADRFAKAAVLVGTETGKLHVQRLVRERGLRIEVFDDESAAGKFAGL